MSPDTERTSMEACMTTAATTRTDDEIQRDVQEELRWDARLQPNEFGVIVDGGVVTLTGWVDSFIKRWAAERAALRVSGVNAVANDIEVRLPVSAERTDADIAAAALNALRWDALVPEERIKVKVSNGWVTLEGEIEWEHEKRAAERAVRGLSGIRGVSNLISVRPRTQPSPEGLKREIRKALVRSAELDARQITVDVQGDRVILSGTVRSWAEQRGAERTAWSAPGVRAVENNIRIML
jgi:osmotically-inducible protein OsmY